jgi:hypothetical protein
MHHNYRYVMDLEIERYMLRERPWCEIPDEHGLQCKRPSAHILTLPSQFTIAVCKECAPYVFKEVGRNVCTG